MKKKTEHRYEVILYWSNEDQAYIAEVPELPGCAADGSSYQEAIANVEVVIDEWIETAKGKGWKIPEPKGRRLLYA
jgi:predicted RNase H-like HicB family nuclease